jgi:hypothetical protein
VQGVSQPLGEDVEAGLAGAVDEVGAAGALAGHGGEHDERAVPLGLQRARGHQAGRDGARVVGLGDPYRRDRVALVVGLVAEDPEGEQHHVDVALGEHLAEHRLVGLGVQRVEGDGVGLGPQRAQLRGGRLQGRGRAPRQPHRAGAADDEAAGGGQRDLGRTAEDEQGLGNAEGVLHEQLLGGPGFFRGLGGSDGGTGPR